MCGYISTEILKTYYSLQYNKYLTGWNCFHLEEGFFFPNTSSSQFGIKDKVRSCFTWIAYWTAFLWLLSNDRIFYSLILPILGGPRSG